MPTTYEFAEPNVIYLLRRVMADWHPALAEAGVLVGVKMARNSDGPAIKHGGYPATATIKVVSAKDRVSKRYDAELLVDAVEWEHFSEGRRRALLDHELSHLVLMMLSPQKLAKARRENPQAPAWAADDKGRPKLRTMPGDWNAGDGFVAVCERHGDDAIEFYILSKCRAKAKAVSQKRMNDLAKEIARASP